MNVEIGAEAALFPEKEYINGIAVAVQQRPFFTFARLERIFLGWHIGYLSLSLKNNAEPIVIQDV
jgi:hypothetical protein